MKPDAETADVTPSVGAVGNGYGSPEEAFGLLRVT